MKKIFAIVLAVTLVFAIAAISMAKGPLYSDADAWFYNAEEAGTLTVADNFNEYVFEVVAGVNELGLQRDYTGQLRFVGFASSEHTCEYIKTFVGAEVAVSIVNVSGNTNPYTFVITEEYAWVCACGETLPNTFEDITFVRNLANNYKGDVNLGEYTVYIYSSGNTTVDELYIK